MLEWNESGAIPCTHWDHTRSEGEVSAKVSATSARPVCCSSGPCYTSDSSISRPSCKGTTGSYIWATFIKSSAGAHFQWKWKICCCISGLLFWANMRWMGRCIAVIQLAGQLSYEVILCFSISYHKGQLDFSWWHIWGQGIDVNVSVFRKLRYCSNSSLKLLLYRPSKAQHCYSNHWWTAHHPSLLLQHHLFHPCNIGGCWQH